MLFCVVWKLFISWMYYGIWDLDYVGTMCTNCQLPKFQKLQHKMKSQGSKAIKVEPLLHFKVLFRFSFFLCNSLKAFSCQLWLFESSLCSWIFTFCIHHDVFLNFINYVTICCIHCSHLLQCYLHSFCSHVLCCYLPSSHSYLLQCYHCHLSQAICYKLPSPLVT
jgi:hypothetical protein